MASSRAARQRGLDVRPFPSSRRMVVGAIRAGRRKAPMHGLLDLDVTDAMARLEAHEPPLSMTAFVVAAVARAVAAHPEVHAYRSWSGRLVTHRRVDVSTIVEIETPQGPFPLVHTLRDADIRDVADLSAELHRVKHAPLSDHVGTAERAMVAASRVPGVLRAIYAVISRSTRARERAGTVAVTAVGMFADGGGFALAQLTVMSLQVVVGGISERPRVVDHEIAVRSVLDLTVSVDHAVVDGAPAARFAAALREEIEGAAVLGA